MTKPKRYLARLQIPVRGSTRALPFEHRAAWVCSADPCLVRYSLTFRFAALLPLAHAGPAQFPKRRETTFHPAFVQLVSTLLKWICRSVALVLRNRLSMAAARSQSANSVFTESKR